MNCRQALRISIAGDGSGNSEFAKHLAGCARCRRLDEIVLGLEQLGGQQRQNDLSDAAIRETRLQAVALLARQRERAAGGGVLELLSLRFLFRPVFAAFAAAAILVAAALFAWRQSAPRPVGGHAEPAMEEMAALEAKIGLLAEHVDADLKGFRDRYRENESPCSVEAMSASLRTDIVSCSMDIRHELRGTGINGRGADNTHDADDRT